MHYCYCSQMVTVRNRIARYRNRVLVLSLAGFFCTPLYAAQQPEQLIRPESLFSLESLLQMLLALIAVVGIIIFLSVVIRRFSLLPGTSSGMIKILGGLALNNKDRLLLIQVGEEQILISASPGRVGKVHDLQHSIDPESFTTQRKSDGTSFAGLLERVTRKSAS